ncbi:MAG: selenium metabolism-associated LysR family transcriptional regulator [Desulfobacterota bacterium]|nr:selenium metabolism-associated LysR family transcriptional regulator [Thermodesulfobacteriota bacterium]
MEGAHLPIDFRHLETFCRVATLKSFSKAAEALYLTQPTVSGHILTLEKSLSLRLLDRNRRGVQLTKAGEILYRFATKLLTTKKELLNALSEFSEGLRGELNLGASTIPGEYLLPGILREFKEIYPSLTVSVKIADTREIVKNLLDGGVEFGLVGAKAKHPSLQFETFAEDEIIVIGPPHSPWSRQKNIKMDALMREPWILREEGSGTRMAVESALKRKGRSLKQFHEVMQMGSTSAIKEGVKAGLGLAFISKRAVEEELARGNLSKIDMDGIDPVLRPIYIVSIRGRTLSPLATAFLRFLKKNRKDFASK